MGCSPFSVLGRLHRVRVRSGQTWPQNVPKLRGFSQLQLATGTSNTRPLLSTVEHGRANLSVAKLTAAARALGVSVDFLCGLTTDPTPVRQFAKVLADSTTCVRDLEKQRAYVGAAAADGDYVGVAVLAGAGDCQLVSADPNKQAWPTVPWPPHAPVIGEVKWAARTFL